MNINKSMLLSNFVILTMAVFLSVVIVSGLLKQDMKKVDVMQVPQDVSAKSIAEISLGLQRLKETITENQQAYREQIEAEKVRANSLLSKLESRVVSLESVDTVGKAITNPEESVAEGPVTEVWAAEPATTNIEERVTDKALWNWIDNSFELGYVDETLTARAAEQAVSSLLDTPDVSMQELKCTERVCRATFNHERGKGRAVLDVFGHPPFMTEGMTVPIDNDHVAVYFTQPGISFDELRTEVDLD